LTCYAFLTSFPLSVFITLSPVWIGGTWLESAQAKRYEQA
jgi:hypothetical protein